MRYGTISLPASTDSYFMWVCTISISLQTTGTDPVAAEQHCRSTIEADDRLQNCGLTSAQFEAEITHCALDVSVSSYGSGPETAAVLLPGFAINW